MRGPAGFPNLPRVARAGRVDPLPPCPTLTGIPAHWRLPSRVPYSNTLRSKAASLAIESQRDSVGANERIHRSKPANIRMYNRVMAEKFLDLRQITEQEIEGVRVSRQPDGRTFILVDTSRFEGNPMETEPDDPFFRAVSGRLSQPTLNAEMVIAATYGRTDRLKAMLNAGAYAKFGDSRALRMAASNGHSDCVELLITKSDVSAFDNEALREAAKGGYADIVEILIRAGADVNARDNDALKLAREFQIQERGAFWAAVETPADGHSRTIAIINAANRTRQPS